LQTNTNSEVTKWNVGLHEINYPLQNNQRSSLNQENKTKTQEQNFCKRILIINLIGTMLKNKLREAISAFLIFF